MNFWAIFAPVAMMSAGMWLQAKDTNRTGADDAVGQICVALSPVVQAAIDGTDSQKPTLTAMIAVRTAADAYIKSAEAATPSPIDARQD